MVNSDYDLVMSKVIKWRIPTISYEYVRSSVLVSYTLIVWKMNAWNYSNAQVGQRIFPQDLTYHISGIVTGGRLLSFPFSGHSQAYEFGIYIRTSTGLIEDLQRLAWSPHEMTRRQRWPLSITWFSLSHIWIRKVLKSIDV